MPQTRGLNKLSLVEMEAKYDQAVKALSEKELEIQVLRELLKKSSPASMRVAAEIGRFNRPKWSSGSQPSWAMILGRFNVPAVYLFLAWHKQTP
jgi:hypothetical protein